MEKKKTRQLSRAFFTGLSYLSPRLNTRLLYRAKFGRFPDLEHPAGLNEKLLKLKLERYGADPLVRQCADKLRVRDFVRDRGLGYTLNRLYAVYDSAAEIDWAALPERFAMKWNFGAGFNLLCADKAALDEKQVRRQFARWGRAPFWAYYSELQYRHMEKKILVEEYIGEAGIPPEDYKFYCFNGRAHCVMLCQGREEGWPKFYFFDRAFRLLRINPDSQAAPADFAPEKPAGLEEAFQAAEILSAGFPFVRVDLYLIKGQVRFGEMTFTPNYAMDKRRLPETDRMFGELCSL